MTLQQTVDFDPNSAMAIDDEPVDLGDHEFEVDAIEASEGSPDDAHDEAEKTGGSSEDEHEESSDDSPKDGDAGGESGEAEGEEPVAEVEQVDKDITDTLDEMPEGNKGQWIPRDRLNQEIGRKREQIERADNALQRVAELEAELNSQTVIAEQAGIDPQIIKDAAEKVLDGDTDAFATVLTDLLNKQAGNSKESQEVMLEQATQNAIAQIQAQNFNTERTNAAESWVAKFPSLDIANKEALNQDALDEAIMLSGMYEDKGYRPQVAMDRAVKAVVASYELKQDPNTMDKPAPVTPRPKRAAKKVVQPAGIGTNTGIDKSSNKVDFDSISQDDWDALPDSVRDKYLNE